MLPVLDDATTTTAGWSAFVTFIGVVAWKLRLWMRGDVREDRADSREDDAGAVAQQIWERTVARLEADIERLTRDVNELREKLHLATERLNVEMNSRYAAEGEARRSGYRLQQLEDELAALKGSRAIGAS